MRLPGWHTGNLAKQKSEPADSQYAETRPDFDIAGGSSKDQRRTRTGKDIKDKGNRDKKKLP